MNTKISYLYRDACNYKVRNEAVVVGTISDKQKKAILDSLDCGEYFIPSAVGLPEVKFDVIDDPEVDHPWFELDEDSFEAVHNKPTVEISAAALVRAFVRHKNCWHKCL